MNLRELSDASIDPAIDNLGSKLESLIIPLLRSLNVYGYLGRCTRFGSLADCDGPHCCNFDKEYGF